MDELARDHDAPSGLRAAHILVLEDSFLILMELESILLEAGATVRTCRNVGEALQAIAEQDVAAAILDVQLDRETSLPVARALSARGVPFFFYTGQFDTGVVCAEWPECRVVSKPAAPGKILETVASLLNS